MTSVSERDWKVFKKMHPLALERMCARILADVNKIQQKPGDSAHERYLALYRLVEKRDEDIARIFNDFRRSTAFFQIAMMESEGLLTPEEWQQFSPELRQQVERTREIFGTKSSRE
jgi:hypothetical protein